MLVYGNPQLTNLSFGYNAGFNFGGGAYSLLGGFGGGGYGGFGGWGGGSFGQSFGWGAAFKSNIYDVHRGKAWDTKLLTNYGRRDPVYLDTNKDGKLNVHKRNVRFDMNGDGIMDRVREWNTKDAQLVYDANRNGKIDNGREIMNEVGVKGRRNKYKNGWEKARAIFDKNKDGIINGNELKHAKFWTDKNGNGKTDKGELRTAAQMNIVSIDTKKGRFTTKKKIGEMRGFASGWGGSGGHWGGGGWGGGGGYDCCCGGGWGHSGWGGGWGGGFGFGFGGGFAGGFSRFF